VRYSGISANVCHKYWRRMEGLRIRSCAKYRQYFDITSIQLKWLKTYYFPNWKPSFISSYSWETLPEVPGLDTHIAPFTSALIECRWVYNVYRKWRSWVILFYLFYSSRELSMACKYQFCCVLLALLINNLTFKRIMSHKCYF